MFRNLIFYLLTVNILISNEELVKRKSRDGIPLSCKCCKSTFYRPKNLVQRAFRKSGGHTLEYCSNICKNQYKREQNLIVVKCKQCNTEFKKHKRYAKKSKNHFCNHSCSTTYHNTHKTTGNRRSKLEIWLEEQLTKLYPTLKIHFNKTDTINSELDIYIPSLKLAFELNGIFHYEPIYGENKFGKTKNNDQRKFQACIERDIALCIIDTSKQTYFKESSSKQFLNIITKIIDNA